MTTHLLTGDDELVDQLDHRVAQDRLVVTGQQMGRHGDLDSYRISTTPHQAVRAPS